MGDVELYWQVVSAKFGDPRQWTELSTNEQHAIIQSINLLLAVLNNGRQQA